MFVKLPAEDDTPGMCGLLLKSMYGTRDAAQNWEFEHAELLENCGFKRGEATPCILNHSARTLRLAVHGGDFTILGSQADLKWLQQGMRAKLKLR